MLIKPVATLGFAAAILAVSLAAQDSPQKGAKELFYDPSGTLSSVAARKTSGNRTPPRSSRASQPPNIGVPRRPLTLPVAGGDRPSANRSLGLSYWIELETPGSAGGVQVTDQRIFKSGERIRLHFSSNVDGFISILQVGSSGVGQILFPNARQGLGNSALAAGQDRILPSQNHWFRFDENPGTEKLIVLFAKDRRELAPSAAPDGPNLPENDEMMRLASRLRGSKDLVIDWETESSSEVGTYGVNLTGQPVLLEIHLKHH